MTEFDPGAAAKRLHAARMGAAVVRWQDVIPPDARAAYAVQDIGIELAGGSGGWKVGARDAQAEPACSPLPSSGIFVSGAKLLGPPSNMRGVELEVGVRLGRDIEGEAPSREDIVRAIEAVVPIIEVVETRLADWKDSAPLAQLADLQNHGALIVGAPSDVDPSSIDLRRVEAYLAFDGQPVATTFGANPAADVWRLLQWLAKHAAQRGRPLRAGDVITTGSCTGMLYAHEGARVQGQLKGIGLVEVTF